MSIKPERVQFNGGELSPWLEGRTDIAKFNKTAKLCQNFIPLAEGSLKRRGGFKVAACGAEGDSIKFSVCPNPPYADVYLNEVKTKNVFVTEGDTVTIDVYADGFEPYHTEVTVSADKPDLTVTLNGLSPVVTVKLAVEPPWATVTLNGVNATETIAPINSDIAYTAKYHHENTFYYTEHGIVHADTDKTVPITLHQIMDMYNGFGSWGKINDFIHCTYVFDGTKFEKCFWIKFENGCLPLRFDMTLDYPEVIREEDFLLGCSDKVNSVMKIDGKWQGVTVTEENECFVWKTNKTLQVYDKQKLAELNWPKKNGRFCLFDDSYDGTPAWGGLYVWKNAKPVWIWKGRENGGR